METWEREEVNCTGVIKHQEYLKLKQVSTMGWDNLLTKDVYTWLHQSELTWHHSKFQKICAYDRLEWQCRIAWKQALLSWKERLEIWVLLLLPGENIFPFKVSVCLNVRESWVFGLCMKDSTSFIDTLTSSPFNAAGSSSLLSNDCPCMLSLRDSSCPGL